MTENKTAGENASGYPGGSGNVPGGERRRRRGGLPGSSDGGGGGSNTPPLGTALNRPQPAANDGLSVTEKPKIPESKVWGLRVSEQHYDTGNMMVDVLATQFRLDKRQVGELLVQYLVSNRFNLFEYVKTTVGPAPIDLDFFTQQQEQATPLDTLHEDQQVDLQADLSDPDPRS